jgi:hypothetical protein
LKSLQKLGSRKITIARLASGPNSEILFEQRVYSVTRFIQRGMDPKVSDEFTEPLRRGIAARRPDRGMKSPGGERSASTQSRGAATRLVLWQSAFYVIGTLPTT